MKSKGFTLIELLAVIVVLALLLVLAVPSIINARKNANSGINNTERKNLKAAGETLGLDLDDYMSEIYNCSSWASGKCVCRDSSGTVGNCSDKDFFWEEITITLKDLIDHDYFVDVDNHCKSSSQISITRSEGSYKVDLDGVTCGASE